MPIEPTDLVLVAVSWILAGLLAVPLWRAPGGAGVKLAWTAILAVPALGPIAFAILHDPPAPKAGCGSCGPASCAQESGDGLTRLGHAEPDEGQRESDLG